MQNRTGFVTFMLLTNFTLTLCLDNIGNQDSSKAKDGEYSSASLSDVVVHEDEIKETNNSSNTKILGGMPANPGQFPFQVALLYQGGVQYCSGSLVSPRHVITAAHCTHGFHPADMKARVGSIHSQKGGIVLRVVEIVQHEKYQGRPTHHEYDISMLVLEKSVPFNNRIAMVNLPRTGADPEENSLTILSGWGATIHGGDGQLHLRFVELPIVSRSKCSEVFSYIEDFANPRNVICAGGEEGKDGCQGDSGGGLILKSNSQTKTLVGIVSNGRGCGHPGVPAIYTNVGKFVHWINFHIFSTRVIAEPQNTTSVA